MNILFCIYCVILFFFSVIFFYTLVEKGLDGFKNIWDYFFNKWEITIDSRGEETWEKRYRYSVLNEVSGQAGKVMPGSAYSKSYVVYKYTHKFNNQTKLVKKYLD